MGEHEEGLNFLFNGEKLLRLIYFLNYNILHCSIFVAVAFVWHISWFMHYFAIHMPRFGRIWPKIEIIPSLSVYSSRIRLFLLHARGKVSYCTFPFLVISMIRKCNSPFQMIPKSRLRIERKAIYDITSHPRYTWVFPNI